MSDFTEALVSKPNAIDPASFTKDDPARQQLALGARKLYYKLETNEEKVLRLAIEEPVLFSNLQVLIDVGLFEGWREAVQAGKADEMSVEELAKVCKKDINPELLSMEL